jgi:hypothetical protein
MNLTEVTQQHFGYPPLLKVDPNTQAPVENKSAHSEHKLSQAAIPAILIGLYKFSLSDPGAQAIVSGDISSNWVKEIFPGYNHEIVDRVASYSGEDKDTVEETLQKIAGKAIEEIRKAIAPSTDILIAKKALADQRPNILPYLPAELRIGDLVDDPSIDDKTNKMEGPVSNFIKAVGAVFSSPDKDATLTHEI